MPHSIQFCLNLVIHDEAAFRQRAYTVAIESGLDEEDAKEYLDEEVQPITACVVMIFDPGTSPPGCQIDLGWAE